MQLIRKVLPAGLTYQPRWWSEDCWIFGVGQVLDVSLSLSSTLVLLHVLQRRERRRSSKFLQLVEISWGPPPQIFLRHCLVFSSTESWPTCRRSRCPNNAFAVWLTPTPPSVSPLPSWPSPSRPHVGNLGSAEVGRGASSWMYV